MYMKARHDDREIEVYVEFGRFSSCDTYLSEGYYMDEKGGGLTETELDELQYKLADKIAELEISEFGYFRD